MKTQKDKILEIIEKKKETDPIILIICENFKVMGRICCEKKYFMKGIITLRNAVLCSFYDDCDCIEGTTKLTCNTQEDYPIYPMLNILEEKVVAFSVISENKCN